MTIRLSNKKADKLHSVQQYMYKGIHSQPCGKRGYEI